MSDKLFELDKITDNDIEFNKTIIFFLIKIFLQKSSHFL